MAITSIEMINEGREGTVEYNRRSYRLVFQVQTDDNGDGPMTVIAAVSSTFSILIGSAYTNGVETDPLAVALKMNATPIGEDGFEWRVTVEYGTPPTPDLVENPLLEPVLLDIEGREFEIAIERDKDGRLIQNSAGDKFDPPLTIEDDRIIVTISRNEATEEYAAANGSYTGPVFDYTAITDNVGKVNSASFLGYGARRIKFLRPRVTREFNQNIGFYWKVIYRFEIIDRVYTKPDPDDPELNPPIELGAGWDRVVLDAGYRYLESGVKKLVTLDGQPVQEPVLLDGAGGRLGDTDPPEYVVFKVHEEVDFSSLITV